MAVNICHASIDERGGISGGQAGDQTGREVYCRTWYSHPWYLVLRYPDRELGKKAAQLAKKLANSNLVGYSQSARNTLYAELKKNKFDVDKYIASKVKTSTDCSAFMFAVWCCVLPKMRADGNAPATSYMEAAFTRAGFKVYKDATYISNDKLLLTGDVLVKPGSHTAMAISDGSNAKSSVPKEEEKKPTKPKKTPFQVTITAEALNIRKGPGIENKICGVVKGNTKHTIIEVKDNWGKLKSLKGWISLKYTKEV